MEVVVIVVAPVPCRAAATTKVKRSIAEIEFLQLSEVDDVFRATAARIRVFRASSLTFSPLWKSMAHVALTLKTRIERDPEDHPTRCP